MGLFFHNFFYFYRRIIIALNSGASIINKRKKIARLLLYKIFIFIWIIISQHILYSSTHAVSSLKRQRHKTSHTHILYSCYLIQFNVDFSLFYIHRTLAHTFSLQNYLYLCFCTYFLCIMCVFIVICESIKK